MPRGEGITLVVLAGGGGTRLGGVHKPLLELEGRPLLVHVLERLGPVTHSAIVVTRTPALYRERMPGLPVVTDRVPDGGPLAGLDAALAACTTEWVALVGGDMPRVHPRALTILEEAMDESAQWIAFVRDGRREPLPALYRRSAKGVIPDLLAKGAGMQALMRETSGVEVPVERLRAHDASLESLQGINTPEDAARLGVVLPRTIP